MFQITSFGFGSHYSCLMYQSLPFIVPWSFNSLFVKSQENANLLSITIRLWKYSCQCFNSSICLKKSSSARYSFSHAWTENSSDIWSPTFRGTNGHSCHKINGIFFHVPTKALWMLKLPSWSIQSMVGFIIYELRWSDTPLKIWGVNQRYNL